MSKLPHKAALVQFGKLGKGLKTLTMEAFQEAIEDIEPPKSFVVEGATVVCTQMSNGKSESKMKKTDTSRGVMMQGSYRLTHKDIEFYPKFERCKYCGEKCEPEITKTNGTTSTNTT